jgi:hypothetical protein
MGKPMKNRILCIALALSLLAAIFVALPTRGAIDYTGSVRPMDNTGHYKDAWLAGDPLYVNVSLYLRGTLVDDTVRIEIQSPSGGLYTWMYGDTNQPVTGFYNSTVAPTQHMHVPTPSGPVGVFYVVAYHDASDTLLASWPITVRSQALTLVPAPAASAYYPGEQIQITWVTTHSTDLFYMHVYNATGVTFVNWSRQVTTVDGWWSTIWTIDANMPDGTYWINARDEATHAFLSPTISFQVQKYGLNILLERTHYMPGETAKITYLVFETATLLPYPGVTITFSSDWLNKTGNKTWLNGTLAGDNGVQEFVIPTNIALYSDINITYWANESTRSAEVHILLVLDQLFATLSVASGPYKPGDTVVATVSARVGPDDLPGAAVNLRVERNGTDLPAYAAENLTTDLAGDASHAFILDSASPQDGYIVTAVVSASGYSVTKKASFYVQWGGSLTVQWDKVFYFSGDTATASFKAVWNNQLIETPSIGYQIYKNTQLLATGNSSGEDVSVSIPAGFRGEISINASLNYNGNILKHEDVSAVVYNAAVVLSPEMTTYSPGNTVTWNYEVVSDLSSVTLTYKVKDATGVIVATGDLSGMSGSFELVVPTDHPSTSYVAQVTLTDASGLYETASSTVTMQPDYALKIWAGKSGYMTGEFKPGQTVKVHYSINSFVNEPLPVYEISLWATTIFGLMMPPDQVQVFQVTEATGVVSFDLPKDTPLGEVYIMGELYDPVSDDDLSEDVTQIAVNTQLSGWDKSVAGMSAISFTLLVLIIIMILLLIIVPYLKGRMGAPKATAEPAKVEPPPPASP